MLSGDRVTLRPVREDDLPTMYTWRIDLATWAATTEQPAYAMTWELYQERARQSAERENAEFAVDVEGTLVGRAGVFGFNMLARSCEVGLHFAPGERGKGYGREVLALLVDFAFRHRNMHRVHLSCLANNEAAIRCYTAAGFVEEGRRRESAWVEGAYVDEVLMSRLVTD
ncbi:MAG TPA: GNAT family protein [Frankiaceae bacterium]|nr:GNAT family protein [Frankiaceae bacterium]